MERWRAFFDKAHADIWTVIEQAINVAAVDHPEVFREKRGDIAETLFARRLLHVVPTHDEVVSLGVLDDIDEHPTSAMEEGELKDDPEERAPAACLDVEAHRLQSSYDEAEALRDDVDQEVALVEEIRCIKQALRDENQQSENILLELLQKLEDMQITVHALKATEIGKQVNVLRKHTSKYVRAVVKRLVKHWKFLVDEWVKSSGDVVEVGAASPVASAGVLLRDEPEATKRIQALPTPPANDALTLPPEKSFSGELTKLFSFMDDEDLCGQIKRGAENDVDFREHSVKGSMQNSSRSHSGSALTYSSDCDGRISSSQIWGLQTPGEMGSATRDNHSSEGMEKMSEPPVTKLPTKNEMGHRGENHTSISQPSSKAPNKPVNGAKIGRDSKSRVSSDEAVAKRSANDHSQRSHYDQKATAPHGSGSVRNVKPIMPNKLSDKDHVEQKLEIAKRKLHQGYQQAETAKKQRTVQVLDFPDLPKCSETRGKTNSAMQSKAGSQPGHWKRNG